MVLSGSNIKETGRYSCVLELLVKLARQTCDDPQLTGE